MSLKLIELQIALPRTQEFGKMTEQLNQRGQIFQHQVAQSQKKQDVKNLKQVTKKSNSSHVSLQKNEHQEHHQSDDYSIHPTKGKIIDIIG
ncbi:hypothetical protein [Litchfieldia salsa]|uniref:Uncharacterized protein n=1 Tax=Litchfieldia salsa TaxID=930152 RepID=A0A1H0R5E2_9BACI|nr:hypothetical protein [Litchfieldia salsa]SDP24752.1 hypothetical protein SAMN05216565_10254 [Litchfieldia salsa]